MDANIAVYIEATFQKIRRLKENEKSEVWLASGKSGRLVILKRIALTGLPYGALKEKDYPLCPRILHAWEDEGGTVVVEEYVQGESLLDRIGRKAYLTEQEAQSVLIQLCDGLAPIHAQGIIHRDIKPSNLILQNGGIIRLIDFDAARTVKEHVAEDTRFLGTK
ncbi:MAG: protein kinase, partial [Selenomonadaceae bacterium]|nr:protein kinase [Selenomonadaceae bacterium]